MHKNYGNQFKMASVNNKRKRYIQSPDGRRPCLYDGVLATQKAKLKSYSPAFFTPVFR